MKKILYAIFCCCFCNLAFAQQPVKTITIKGIVIDSANNKPLGFVTASLADAATKQPVKSALTKDNGAFELKGLPPKPYQLAIIAVGYATKTIPASGNSDFDAGRIMLSPSSNQLKEVGVTALKPLMKQEVDRISYDVQADPESKALTALDMMRKVPLIAVDGSDNIKLKGSGNYKILINGRESALMAKNPSDVLKAMPATNIEKIEVITTPPAKYDAEGLSGIINIITKKNADQGYNMGINTRYNTAWGSGLNLNGNVKQGKFGMSGYLGMGRNNNNHTSNGTQQIFSNQSSILQSGQNEFGGNYKYANAELSYEMDSLNLITGSFEFFNGKFFGDNNQLFNNFNNAGASALAYNVLNDAVNHYYGLDAAVNYQLGFKNNKDRLFTLSYKFSYSPTRSTADNSFLSRFNYPAASFPDYQQYNNAGNKEHTIQLDYAHPLKKITIEAGAKAIMRNNFSDFHRDDFDTASNLFVTNNSQTNNFNYQQGVYSLYNSYQLKLSKWTAKAGLRLERTTVDADFTSAATSVNQGYNNFIPSISVQRTFKTNSISLGYTERIQRPGIYQLNPFVDRNDPKFLNVGNPDLRPELSHTFELNYSNFSKNSFTAGLSYAFSNNAIQNVSSLGVEQVNGKSDTVTITTYQNLGTNKTLGLNFNTNLAVTKKINLSLNGQVSHVWLAGTFNGKYYKNDGYSGNAFLNAAYKFDKGYRISLDAGYFSGNVNLQGSSSKFVYSSVSVLKEFLNKKASIALAGNNPWSKFQTYRSITNSADFYQNSFNQNVYRTFAIRLNYKFGKLNSQIKRNQHGINNDDTKGGGNKSGGNNQ